MGKSIASGSGETKSIEEKCTFQSMTRRNPGVKTNAVSVRNTHRHSFSLERSFDFKKESAGRRTCTRQRFDGRQGRHRGATSVETRLELGDHLWINRYGAECW